MLFPDENQINNDNIMHTFSSKSKIVNSSKIQFIQKSHNYLITTHEDLLYCNGNTLVIYRHIHDGKSDNIIEESYKFSKIFYSMDSDLFSGVRSSFLEGKNVLVTILGYDLFPPIVTSDFISINYLLFKQFDLDSAFEMPSSILRSQLDLNLSPITVISQKKSFHYMIILCLPISTQSSSIKDLISQIINQKLPTLSFFSSLWFNLSVTYLFLNNVDSESSISILHSVFPNFSTSIIPFNTYFTRKIQQQQNSFNILQNDISQHMFRYLNLQSNRNYNSYQNQFPERNHQLQILLEQKFQIEQQILNYQNLVEKIQKENEETKEKIEEKTHHLTELVQEKENIENIIRQMITYTKEMRDEVNREEKRKEKQVNYIDSLIELEPSQGDVEVAQERSKHLQSMFIPPEFN